MWKTFRVKQSLKNKITEEKSKSGYYKKLLSIQLLIASVIVMLFCSGCAGKMNAKKIFRQSSENMQKVTSSANHVELAIQMSDILNLMEVNMEMRSGEHDRASGRSCERNGQSDNQRF